MGRGITVGRACQEPRRPPRATWSASGLPRRAFVTQTEIDSHHELFQDGECPDHGWDRMVLIHNTWRFICCGKKAA